MFSQSRKSRPLTYQEPNTSVNSNALAAAAAIGNAVRTGQAIPRSNSLQRAGSFATNSRTSSFLGLPNQQFQTPVSNQRSQSFTAAHTNSQRSNSRTSSGSSRAVRPTKPRKVKKYVPGPYGLTTIEVEEETPVPARTSSLSYSGSRRKRNPSLTKKQVQIDSGSLRSVSSSSHTRSLQAQQPQQQYQPHLDNQNRHHHQHHYQHHQAERQFEHQYEDESQSLEQQNFKQYEETEREHHGLKSVNEDQTLDFESTPDYVELSAAAVDQYINGKENTVSDLSHIIEEEDEISEEEEELDKDILKAEKELEEIKRKRDQLEKELHPLKGAEELKKIENKTQRLKGTDKLSGRVDEKVDSLQEDTAGNINGPSLVGSENKVMLEDAHNSKIHDDEISLDSQITNSALKLNGQADPIGSSGTDVPSTGKSSDTFNPLSSFTTADSDLPSSYGEPPTKQVSRTESYNSSFAQPSQASISSKGSSMAQQLRPTMPYLMVNNTRVEPKKQAPLQEDVESRPEPHLERNEAVDEKHLGEHNNLGLQNTLSNGTGVSSIYSTGSSTDLQIPERSIKRTGSTSSPIKSALKIKSSPSVTNLNSSTESPANAAYLSLTTAENTRMNAAMSSNFSNTSLSRSNSQRLSLRPDNHEKFNGFKKQQNSSQQSAASQAAQASQRASMIQRPASVNGVRPSQRPQSIATTRDVHANPAKINGQNPRHSHQVTAAPRYITQPKQPEQQVRSSATSAALSAALKKNEPKPPALQRISSFEKERLSEKNAAFKRKSLRDPTINQNMTVESQMGFYRHHAQVNKKHGTSTAQPVQHETAPPQFQVTSGGFRSRFNDSDSDLNVPVGDSNKLPPAFHSEFAAPHAPGLKKPRSQYTLRSASNNVPQASPAKSLPDKKNRFFSENDTHQLKQVENVGSPERKPGKFKVKLRKLFGKRE